MNFKAAFLWDESFLWGLMAYESLKKNCLPFELIRSDDIKNKKIHTYKMLFVPGGWASNKLKTLGEEGITEIKRFVENGGAYLGFCGGAGLATMDGIGLLNIKRRATKERVPSFSGRIKVNTIEHPIWMNLSKDIIFHAWWPSQFIVHDEKIRILANYREAMPDAFTSDLCIGDVINSNNTWNKLEAIYKINLDPLRLYGEPAVVEGYYGKGKVILSLIHFDTPDDLVGHSILKRLWEYLLEDEIPTQTFASKNCSEKPCNASNLPIIIELFDTVQDLVNLGTRNFLWYKKNPMLFQWRRGVRGLEYCTLYVLIKKIAELLTSEKPHSISDEDLNTQLLKIRDILLPFCEKSKQLLILERFALQDRHITYEKSDDLHIQTIRNELFSNSKSYGGMFKRLLNMIDKLLYDLLT